MVVNSDDVILDRLGLSSSSKVQIGKAFIYVYQDIGKPGSYDLISRKGTCIPMKHNASQSVAKTVLLAKILSVNRLKRL